MLPPAYIGKTFTTRNGHSVTLDSYTERNATGNILSFPLGGTIRFKDRPRKKTRCLWTLSGRARSLGEHPFDLVDFPPMLLQPTPPCMDCCGTPLTPFKSVA